MKLTSPRPYLLRALYEWILDNHLTPYLLVDVTVSGVVVPAQYVKDSKIVLNISPTAVRAFQIDNESIVFSTRFGGVAYDINIPIFAVKAIYSKENGKGMVFPEKEQEPEDSSSPPPPLPPRKPRLKLIK